MASFQNNADVQLTAFQHSTLIRLRRKSPRVLVTRNGPRACAEQQKVRSSETAKIPVQATPRSSPSEAPRAVRKEGLINRPEAVLSLLAFGFLASVAHLAYAGRRIAASVSTRAKKIAFTSSQAQRYKARLREKEFLESAIQATSVTLSNTEEFLKKQIIRADYAEARLRKLEINNSELDALTERKNDLRTQFKEKEAELQDKRLQTRENKELLVSLEADLEERRTALATFEKDVEDARLELRKAQEAASRNLELALTERTQLEGILELKQVQLAEEKAAREEFLQRISSEEEKLQQTEKLVDQTLNDIEARRRKINIVAQEAEHIGKVISQGKLALETAVVREIRAEDITESVEQIRAKQSALRTKIQTSRKLEVQQESHCSDLKREIKEREELLRKQKQRMDELHHRVSGRSQASHTEVNARGTQIAPDDWRTASKGTSPHKAFQSESIHDNVQSTFFSPSSTMTKPKVSATVSTAMGDDNEFPVKRRRGRPRKSDSERPQETKGTKSNRGRGRPRTRRVENDVTESVPKRKRGRPRKSSMTVTQKSNDQGTTTESLTR